MNSTELAVNWFCATQAEEKLIRDQVSGKDITEQTHFEVRQKVSQAIGELGGSMPKTLPAPEVIIK
jgi:DNA-damage-inducible protein D